MTTAPARSTEHEEALLGCLFMDPDLLHEVEDLTLDHFWHGDHKILFDHMRRCQQQHGTFDAVLVRSSFASSVGQDRDLGSFTHTLRTVLGAAFSTSSFPVFLERVRSAKMVRDVDFAARDMLVECDGWAGPGDELAQLAAGRFAKIAEDGVTEELSLRELHALVLEQMDAPQPPGFETSFTDLTDVPRLVPAELIVVGGRPGHGKTSLMSGLALDVAKASARTVVFSVEEKDVRFMRRLIACEANVSKRGIRDGTLGEDAKRRARETGWIGDLPLVVDRAKKPTVQHICAQVRRYHRQEPVNVVVVDYLQKLRSHGCKRDRRLEIGEITGALKQLALDLDLTVVLGSQLSRDSMKGSVKDSRPKAHHFRDSGEIEQDADILWSVWQRYMVDQAEWSQGVVELATLKNRDGERGKTAYLWLDGARLWRPSFHGEHAKLQCRKYQERESAARRSGGAWS